jgi:hypothetical protein
VQLIFDRRVNKTTPGRFRTRVITEGRALRTETTINNKRDFGVGKLLKNLPAEFATPAWPTSLL